MDISSLCWSSLHWIKGGNLEMLLAQFFVQKRGGYQFFVLEFFVLDERFKSGNVFILGCLCKRGVDISSLCSSSLC